MTVIGHPDDDRYPIDPDEVAAAAAENHTAIELNNGSLNPLSTRINGPKNIRKVLEACRKYRTMVLMGTDMSVELAKDMQGDSIKLQAITTQMPYEMVLKQLKVRMLKKKS